MQVFFEREAFMLETGQNISHFLLVEESGKSGTAAKYRTRAQKGKGYTQGQIPK